MDEGFEKPEADIQTDAAPAKKNKLMSILAYVGPLVIVSYIVAKDDASVKFHIKQGLVLLVGMVALWLAASVFPWFGLWILWGIGRLAVFILAIIGIVNAANDKQKELPLVGQYAKYFAF